MDTTVEALDATYTPPEPYCPLASDVMMEIQDDSENVSLFISQRTARPSLVERHTVDMSISLALGRRSATVGSASDTDNH